MSHTPPGHTREKVWQFVRDRLLAGFPPTVREVQRAFGFRAVESARAHMEALAEAGLLEKDEGDAGRARARGYRLPRSVFPTGAPAPALVPVLGRVQAGALTSAVEEMEGAVSVQTRCPPGELFALRVRGDSMRGAGILDGDLVVVRRQPTAADGQIVVALVGDEATVKRFRVVAHPAPEPHEGEIPAPGTPAADPAPGRRREHASGADDADGPPSAMPHRETSAMREGPLGCGPGAQSAMPHRKTSAMRGGPLGCGPGARAAMPHRGTSAAARTTPAESGNDADGPHDANPVATQPGSGAPQDRWADGVPPPGDEGSEPDSPDWDGASDHDEGDGNVTVRAARLPRIELHPENPDFDVIVPQPGDVHILGRVIEVRRHLDPSSPPPWEGSGLEIVGNPFRPAPRIEEPARIEEPGSRAPGRDSRRSRAESRETLAAGNDGKAGTSNPGPGHDGASGRRHGPQHGRTPPVKSTGPGSRPRRTAAERRAARAAREAAP